MSKIIHITLAKSGSQWVRDVLCHPEILNFVKKEYSGISLNMNLIGDYKFPEDQFSGPVFGMTTTDWNSGRNKDKSDKAIVVLRDPRDRIVSLLYSLTNSHSDDLPVIRCFRKLLSEQGSLENKLKILSLYSESTIRFYKTWADYEGDDALVVKYEDLIKPELNSFKYIFKWLGWGGIPDDLVDKVLNELSFRNRAGREPGIINNNSHLRKGVAGDWVFHFNIEMGRLWEELFPSLLTATGYEATDQWWERLPKTL